MIYSRIVSGLLALGILAIPFLTTGCSQPTPSGIVCTTGMVAELVRNVGGEHVQGKVIVMMGPGTDPHQYQLSTTDRDKLANAEIVFYSGLGLEHKMTDTLAQMNNSDRPSIPVTRGLDKSGALIREPDSGIVDPHVWHDVALWSKCAEVVAEELSKKYPQHKADFEKNLKAYQKKLADLDKYAKAQIATLKPPVGEQKPVLVTAHDAFSYFAERYGMHVEPLQGKNTVAEPTLARMNELTKYLTDKKIKAIFVESSLSPDKMKKLQDNCRDEKHNLQIEGTELFSDALGKPGTPAETYEGMIRSNVDTIVKALQ